MTRRQLEVLDWITAYIERETISPSFKEIAAGLGLKSIATVHKHLQVLKRSGSISYIAGSGFARTIQVASLPNRCRECWALRKELEQAYGTIGKLRAIIRAENKS